MKILILYSEIANYTLACLKALVHEYPQCELVLVKKPTSQEAPFEFQFDSRIKVKSRSSFTTDEQLLEFAKDIDPDLILCGGWNDKGYLKVGKYFNRKIPVIIAFDNHWTGSLKQYIGSLMAPFTLRKSFNGAFVPGKPQLPFADRIGFKKDQVRTGFYCCDTKAFAANYKPEKKFNKRFLYVGRYYDFKGISDLLDAYSTLDTDWELWCAGTGDFVPKDIPGVKHFGFVQPSDLGELIQACDVAVVPSRVEPWGVVVQEYAASGLPLICSDVVGAATSFLEEGQNGYFHRAGSVKELAASLKKMTSLSEEELRTMAVHSHALGMKHTPEQWARTFVSFIKTAKPKN